MYKGTELISLAEEQLATRGAKAKAYCGLSSNSNYCDAFVTWLFYKCGVKNLYCNGTKQTYCPTSIKWCQKNLANIPIYIAMEGDVIFFDWEPNGDPNHVGMVRGRVSDVQIDTVEGNTSGYDTTGVVANKTRPLYYNKKRQIQGVYRPLYHVDDSLYDVTKPLVIDGEFGFNTIAKTQVVLYLLIDAELGQKTVKAIQKKVGADADGSWGDKTSKAMQKFLKKEGLYDGEIDGFAGAKTVKGWQKWVNAEYEKNFGKTETKPQEEAKPVETKPVEKTMSERFIEALEAQYNWSKNQEYHWRKPTIPSSKKQGTCVTFPACILQRLGIMPKGKYFYLTMSTGKITGTGKKYVLNHPEIYKVTYPHKSVRNLIKADKIKKLDIVAFTGTNGHIMIYRGVNKNGDPLFSTMGHKRGLKIQYEPYDDKKVAMLVRVLKIPKQK